MIFSRPITSGMISKFSWTAFEKRGRRPVAFYFRTSFAYVLLVLQYAISIFIIETVPSCDESKYSVQYIRRGST
jgi:hypothetical protein